MLTARIALVTGAVAALLISGSVAAQASVRTEVHCNTMGKCSVVAHAAGKPGGGHGSGSASHSQAASGHRSTGGSGVAGGRTLVASGGAAVRVPAAPAAAPLTPSQMVAGSASLAACGGRNPTNFIVCLGTPATARGTTPVAAGKASPKAPPPRPATPAELAAAALATLDLPTPKIGSAPCTGPDCMGAVGVPVWLWTQPWTPKTTTAAVRGTKITATAKVAKVTWSMGDGGTVTCKSPGTPYRGSYGFEESPDCGYMYTKTSADMPGMRYPVSATATWNVTWAGDETGSTTTTTRATVQVMVGEYQVLTQ